MACMNQALILFLRSNRKLLLISPHLALFDHFLGFMEPAPSEACVFIHNKTELKHLGCLKYSFAKKTQTNNAKPLRSHQTLPPGRNPFYFKVHGNKFFLHKLYLVQLF